MSLGWALAFGVAATAYPVWAQVDELGFRDSQAGELLGAAIVFLAGVIDDGFGAWTGGSGVTCEPCSTAG